jgi:hypothetical protein
MRLTQPVLPLPLAPRLGLLEAWAPDHEQQWRDRMAPNVFERFLGKRRFASRGQAVRSGRRPPAIPVFLGRNRQDDAVRPESRRYL